MNKQPSIYIVTFGLMLLLALTSASANAQTGGWVKCWGFNGNGQCNVPAGLSGIKAIAAGGYHSLALKSDGTVISWGDNYYGQTEVPAGLSGVVAIAGGRYHSLALKSDGTVVAWGYNLEGEINVPAGLSGVVAIAAGYQHSMALKSDGTVVVWGSNTYGQTTVPAGLSSVSAIAAGDLHSLALKSDGTVVAWGYNESGQSNVPAGLSDVKAIAAGYHSLALKSDGTIVAWGSNSFGQATIPPGLNSVADVAIGRWSSLVLKSDGTVTAWGYNNYGQTTVPAALSGVTAISAGVYHSLAMTAPLNWAPVAQNVTAQTSMNRSAPVTLSATDQDTSDTLTYLLAAPPQHGKLTLGAPGTYTPDPNYTGTDTFQYRAYDGTALSNLAGGTITISPLVTSGPPNLPPVAQPDFAMTTRGTKVTINVLANDSDPDEDPLMLVGVTQGAYGKVAVNPDNTLTYSPQNSMGLDRFYYVVSDGKGGTAVAAVSVLVTKKHEKP